MSKSSADSVSPTQRWKKTAELLSTAIKPERGKLIDSVRVRISDKVEGARYQQELGQSTQTRRAGGPTDNILKMTDAELETHKLTYNGTELCQANGRIADTTGQYSKGKPGQIFVMAKDGNMYTGTYESRNTKGELLVHGSFLSDRPAEMAGTVEIKDGKFTNFTNNSGHYGPDALDMYRGIAKLKETMPDAFASDCKIQITSTKGKMKVTEEGINDFITRMETRDIEGVALHENLRNQRLAMLTDYKENVKRARPISPPIAASNLSASSKESATLASTLSQEVRPKEKAAAVSAAIQDPIKDSTKAITKKLRSYGVTSQVSSVTIEQPEGTMSVAQRRALFEKVPDVSK